MGWLKNSLDKAEARKELGKYNCRGVGIYALIDGEVMAGSKKYPAKDCHAEIIEGGQRQRMTATRVGTGALLFGPVGAIIGGMSKKDISQNWMIVATPDGTEQVKVNGKGLAKARTFVMKLELEAARQEGNEPADPAELTPIDNDTQEQPTK